MSEPLKDQIEALVDLQQHPGWHIFREAVLQEVTGDFQEHITRALDVADEAIALDRLRQVAAVRKAGLRWLKIPTEKVQQLKAQAEQQQVGMLPGSRRPLGV